MRLSRICGAKSWLSVSTPLLFINCLLLLLLNELELSAAAKILIIHPIYSGSHVLTLRSVAESLTLRGHHVHVLRWKDMHSFPAVINSNITETLLSIDNSHGYWTFLSHEKHAAFKMPYELLWNSGLSYKVVIEAGREAFPLLETQCDTLLSDSKLIDGLRADRYDLAIIDILYNECGLALLNHLKIPSVGYWAFPFSSGEADYTTAFMPSSHVPGFMSKLSHEMTFLERIYNVLMKFGSHLTMQLQCYYVNRSVQRYLPGSSNVCDLLKDMNGMLINTDYAMDYPRLLPPTFINVGGMQIRKPKPLPQEIESWMESSGDDGVVLFTMGFIFNPKVVPKKLVNAFMDAFSRLPQKFLVKFEGPIDFVPENVKVLEWIPQQDILAHPKTRAFLTHCGLHGVMEAVYYGVPMVGMPIFIDQGDALIKMIEKGIALGFDKETATSDEIYSLLKEVINNPKFTQNIRKLSLLMRDVPEPPLDRVMNFIEYLVRHKGAEHLKLSSRHLNAIQYFCLDTLAFIGLILVALIYASFLVFRLCFKRLLPGVRQVVYNLVEMLLNQLKHDRKPTTIMNEVDSDKGTKSTKGNNNNGGTERTFSDFVTSAVTDFKKRD